MSHVTFLEDYGKNEGCEAFIAAEPCYQHPESISRIFTKISTLTPIKAVGAKMY